MSSTSPSSSRTTDVGDQPPPSPSAPTRATDKSSRYPCDHAGCTKGFSRRDHLERHQLNHVGKINRCALCGASFARPDVLKRHVANHALKPATGAEDELVPAADGGDGSSAPKKRRLSPSPVASTSQLPSSTSPHLAQARPGVALGLPQLAADSVPIQPAGLQSTPVNSLYHSLFDPPPPAPLAFQSFAPVVASSARDVSALADAQPHAAAEWCFPPPASPLPNVVAQAPIANMDDMLQWLFTSSGDTPESLASFGLNDPAFGGGGGGESSLMALAQVALPESTAAMAARPQTPVGASLLSAGGWDVPEPEELVTEERRRAVLDLAQPTSAAAADDLARAFSLNSMRIFVELFFLYFDPLHPILHRPTLAIRPGGVSPYVLAAMCCIGSAYAEDKSGWKAAVGFSKRLRNRILEIVEENPRIEIDLLQTLMLVNWFGRFFCSATMHDVSQVFHSSSITLAGFSGVLVPEEPPESYERSRDGWCAWAVAEERTRLAWFVFLTDTSNAALFRAWLLVHCYYLTAPFPCADPLWHATTVPQWNQEHVRSEAAPKELSFRDALRLLVGRGQISPSLNDFSVWILLHGLISICWTLLWRDLGDLSMVHESKITGWKDTLRLSFGFWRDFVSKRFVARTSAGWDPLDMHCHWAGISLCHTGVILLLSETDLIRIFAGATEVAGRFIAPNERAAAHRRLHTWARSADGQHSFKAALELLKQIYSWASESRFQTGPATTPWCVYIATLIVWAFTTLTDGRANLIEPAFVSFTSPLDTEPKIEPSLARKAAILYCSRLLAAPTLDDLSRIEGKNRCGSVVAYSTALCGDRGIMVTPRATLVDLLMGRK